MSLYDRIRGTSGADKIAIWPLLNDLHWVLDGDFDFTEVAARHNLSADEAAELGSIAQQRMAQGNSRMDDFHRLWHVLTAVERGVMDWPTAKEKLGVV